MQETRVRLAEPADAALILEMIHALAAFEQESDKVVATLEDIRREGFGPNPAFECLIAENDCRPAGLALFFHNYSTWTGRRRRTTALRRLSETPRRGLPR